MPASGPSTRRPGGNHADLATAMPALKDHGTDAFVALDDKGSLAPTMVGSGRYAKVPGQFFF